ncbi:ABC transporter ATP-binding protein [Geomicrobium sp. JSM 1781026]|uniref:ABC transporter ATP-binding protein n=1 Tax=Geomicrobium sp. JSM 1781026 TaxID=3344580 RepID=UPI0035C1DA5F
MTEVNQEIVLGVQGLSKTYRMHSNDVKALKNVTFNLYKGELVAIMGTSGSGKSTLLNILGAMDQPTEGEISINGKPSTHRFKEPYATDYRRKNIGFIFQSFNLLKDLSVEENIALPLILNGESKATIQVEVQCIVKLVGLEKWANHQPYELSGGQQQRVAIARALITSPPVLLADELTGNLDFNTSKEILRVLTSMKEEQLIQSMILVTHDPYVATFADRVLFFHDGQIVDTYVMNDDTDNMLHILEKFKHIVEL